MYNHKVQIINCDNPAEKTAEAIATYIKPKTLFMLAGGSAKDVYAELPKFLKSRSYENVAVVMEDERWDINPHHYNSNFEAIRDMKFLKILEARGAQIFPLLNGLHIKEDTEKFEKLIESYINNKYEIILLMGIGKDGHTAGILPTDNQTFNNTYNNDKWSTYHTSIDSIFPKRITITPKTIKHASKIFVYAIGEEKWAVLKQIVNADNVSKTPAKIFYEIDATVYTDIHT